MIWLCMEFIYRTNRGVPYRVPPQQSLHLQMISKGRNESKMDTECAGKILQYAASCLFSISKRALASS